MRKAKKQLEAAVSTQHDDEKARGRDGKIALGQGQAALPTRSSGSKKWRRGHRLDG